MSLPEGWTQERWEREEPIYARVRVPLVKMADAMSLTAVVGSVVGLQAASETTVEGPCPFCAGGRIVISVKRPQFWNCVGCWAGGTVIKFIEKMIKKVDAEAKALLERQPDDAA